MLDTRPGEMVPIPLTVDAVEPAIFHRTVAPREIVTAIITDRAAALLCLGLSSLDDATLGFFADHPQLLERIHERSAPAFAVFAGSLRVQGGRVVPPGGDAAVPLWEALALEKVTRPERFIQQLFELTEGRLAYLYDVIGALDPPRRAFALGLWQPNAALRAERFKALALGVGAFRESHLRTLPLARASYDLGDDAVADRDRAPTARPRRRIRAGSGRASSPAPTISDDAARQLRGAEEEPIDAAWLVDTIGAADVRAAPSASISSPSRSVCSAAPIRRLAPTCSSRCAR